MGDFGEELKNKLNEMRGIKPTSKEGEKTLAPEVPFSQDLKVKVQAMKEDETLGLTPYEARKLKALKEQEAQKDASKPKTVKRKGIFGEELP